MPPIPREVFWLVCVVVAVAAVIDGRKLKVPNWLTYPFAAAGVGYAVWAGGAAGLWGSLAGLATGLALLMPLYAIGGMGAGDVKLLAGVGAWVGPVLTLGAFVSTAIVGGVLAVAMVVRSGELAHHWAQFQEIGREILVLRDPAILSRRAAERKPTMMLLPYGIPIALGTIGYFAAIGLLF